ncbi:NUDIX hydrolase [Lactococcus lactis]|uniref:Putative 8-oxo-dGTP diphosphatase n=2 Tax=Lactococcus lactis TaxID=1358 RepID=A0A2N5WE58_LACLL|nr:NUDIX hydrolase [Lactococcus lactis]MBU5243096.1 NUDIX hydrolase [Lactococcus lactis]MDT2857687.1 NUDIX hydrolase [Lactococcus lactis]PLW60521.1 putative 8-oxo-dGTP diphosphatase [Lactococcus lactis subsp. lactis]
MKTSGAFVICQNDEDKILLVKRRDFPLWDLPGGRVERAEKIEQAAIRECFEETGFIIKINDLSGIYFNPELNDRQYIFSGGMIGGHSIDYGEETAAVRFFSPNHLPFFMIPHRKMQIKNLLTDSTTVIHQEIHDSWLVKYIKKH